MSKTNPADTLAALADDIADIFQIGSEARTPSTILQNVRNAARRANCLSAIEQEFFTIETAPDPDEGDTEPGEECLLNWGHGPAEYVEQFRRALASLKGEAEPVGDVRDYGPVLYCQLPPGTKLYTAPPAPQAVGEAINWPLVREGLDYFDRAGDAGDKLYVAEIRKALSTPSPAPQGGGECQHEEWDTSSNGKGYVCAECGEYMKDCEPDFATPPAQQPGEVGLPDGAAYILRDQLSRKFAVMLSEKSCAELLTAALAPKEKGNG